MFVFLVTTQSLQEQKPREIFGEETETIQSCSVQNDPSFGKINNRQNKINTTCICIPHSISLSVSRDPDNIQKEIQNNDILLVVNVKMQVGQGSWKRDQKDIHNEEEEQRKITT